MPIIPLRPADGDARASNLVLSIDSKWLDQIRAGTLLHLIRKRVPKGGVPKYVYLHAKSPISAIVAKAQLLNLVEVPLAEALGLAGKLQMTHGDISSYVGSSSTIGLLVFRGVALARDFGYTHVLREKIDYHPPQTFSFVSEDASNIIDRICGF